MEGNKKYIRFIDSQYNNLFHMEDGKNIHVTYPDGEKRQLPCRYLDEYHIRVGSTVYHICQFAELMERNGAKYEPEEYITDKSFYEKRYLDRDLKDNNGKKCPFYKIDENEKWLFGFCPEGGNHQVCLVDKSLLSKDSGIYFGEKLEEISELLVGSGLNVKMIEAVVEGMKKAENMKNNSLDGKIKGAEKRTEDTRKDQAVENRNWFTRD